MSPLTYEFLCTLVGLMQFLRNRGIKRKIEKISYSQSNCKDNYQNQNGIFPHTFFTWLSEENTYRSETAGQDFIYKQSM